MSVFNRGTSIIVQEGSDLSVQLAIDAELGAREAEASAAASATAANADATATAADRVQTGQDRLASETAASQAALYDGPWLDDVAALLADTTLTYTGGSPSSVAAGDYVRTRAEGFSYEVAASAATDQHVTTAGGVKLYVLPLDGALHLEQFGARAEPLFDNGPIFRAARAAAESLGSAFASMPIKIGFGTFEIRTAEADGSAGVRFQKAPNLQGQGFLSTIFHWHTDTANRPLFLVDPAVATASWGVKMRDFAIWARVGAAAGGGVLLRLTSPSASFGSVVDSVRVVGCYDGIKTESISGTTVYGGVIKNCSVEQVISGGRGFDIGGAYMEMDNCEAYPSFDGTGETAFAFYLTAAFSRYKNLRAAGPVYADAGQSEIDITVEGQSSTCAHNGNAAVRINRMSKIRATLLGARMTGETLPRYGLNLQDSGYLVEGLHVEDIGGYSSPITPLVGGGGGAGRKNTILVATASGTGVLKPEDDIETGLDPTQGGKWQIINGGTWTNYGKWTAAYDPGSIAAGASETVTVACSGLRNPDPVVTASFSITNADIDVSAKFLSATNVQVRFSNRGAGAIDLGAGTITVRALLDSAGAVP